MEVKITVIFGPGNSGTPLGAVYYIFWYLDSLGSAVPISAGTVKKSVQLLPNQSEIYFPFSLLFEVEIKKNQNLWGSLQIFSNLWLAYGFLSQTLKLLFTIHNIWQKS